MPFQERVMRCLVVAAVAVLPLACDAGPGPGQSATLSAAGMPGLVDFVSYKPSNAVNDSCRTASAVAGGDGLVNIPLSKSPDSSVDFFDFFDCDSDAGLDQFDLDALPDLDDPDMVTIEVTQSPPAVDVAALDYPMETSGSSIKVDAALNGTASKVDAASESTGPFGAASSPSQLDNDEASSQISPSSSPARDLPSYWVGVPSRKERRAAAAAAISDIPLFDQAKKHAVDDFTWDFAAAVADDVIARLLEEFVLDISFDLPAAGKKAAKFKVQNVPESVSYHDGDVSFSTRSASETVSNHDDCSNISKPPESDIVSNHDDEGKLSKLSASDVISNHGDYINISIASNHDDERKLSEQSISDTISNRDEPMDITAQPECAVANNHGDDVMLSKQSAYDIICQQYDEILISDEYIDHTNKLKEPVTDTASIPDDDPKIPNPTSSDILNHEDILMQGAYIDYMSRSKRPKCDRASSQDDHEKIPQQSASNTISNYDETLMQDEFIDYTNMSKEPESDRASSCDDHAKSPKQSASVNSSNHDDYISIWKRPESDVVPKLGDFIKFTKKHSREIISKCYDNDDEEEEEYSHLCASNPLSLHDFSGSSFSRASPLATLSKSRKLSEISEDDEESDFDCSEIDNHRDSSGSYSFRCGSHRQGHHLRSNSLPSERQIRYAHSGRTGLVSELNGQHGLLRSNSLPFEDHIQSCHSPGISLPFENLIERSRWRSTSFSSGDRIQNGHSRSSSLTVDDHIEHGLLRSPGLPCLSRRQNRVLRSNSLRSESPSRYGYSRSSLRSDFTSHDGSFSTSSRAYSNSLLGSVNGSFRSVFLGPQSDSHIRRPVIKDRFQSCPSRVKLVRCQICLNKFTMPPKDPQPSVSVTKSFLAAWGWLSCGPSTVFQPDTKSYVCSDRYCFEEAKRQKLGNMVVLSISSQAPTEPQAPNLPQEGITLGFVQKMLEWFRWERTLLSDTAAFIIQQATAILEDEPNVVNVDIADHEKLTICGDLHGQFEELLTIWDINGYPDLNRRYIFNGNFVDHGTRSVEVVLALFAFKVLYPESVFLIRGNQESRYLNERLHFRDEINKKFSEHRQLMFNLFSSAFCQLPLAALLSGDTQEPNALVVHGGLFSSEVSLHHLNEIDRKQQPNFRTEPQMYEMLWAEPQSADGVDSETRGIGKIRFGPDVTMRFLQRNNLKMVIRSHEYVHKGYSVRHRGHLVTVFSAANYRGAKTNFGAFLRIDHSLNVIACRFRPRKPLLSSLFS